MGFQCSFPTASLGFIRDGRNGVVFIKDAVVGIREDIDGHWEVCDVILHRTLGHYADV